MRPDTRSFSFTWMKGQQHQREVNLGLGSANSRSKNQGQQNSKPPGSVRLEQFSTPSPGRKNQKQNKIDDNTRVLSIARKQSLRSFRSTIWNPKNYSAISETDSQTQEARQEPTESSARKDPNINDSAISSKPSLKRQLNKTMRGVRSSFGGLGELLGINNTRRRYLLPMRKSKDIVPTPTRQVLGRTPTKLYSPFGFDSPVKNVTAGLSRSVTPRTTGVTTTPLSFYTYSPTNNLNQDVRDVRRGLRELDVLSRNITRRSVRF